jgi:hypothetical protein
MTHFAEHYVELKGGSKKNVDHEGNNTEITIIQNKSGRCSNSQENSYHDIRTLKFKMGYECYH